MTFPVVAQTSSHRLDTTQTSHTYTLPTGISAGDLVVLTFSTIDATAAWPAGWNELFNTLSTAVTRHTAAYRFCDGSEGASITVTTNNARQSTGNGYRVTGADVSTPPEVGTPATGNDTLPNPPNLGPSWGAEDTLWLVTMGCQANAPTNSYPTNYTNGFRSASGGGISTDRTNSSSARRDLNASSENPGTFDVGPSNRIWVANTIAIRPSQAIEGDFSGTDGADLAAFTGFKEIWGTLAGTDGADAAAFSGEVLIEGTFAGTDGADLAALSGLVLVQGTFSGTDGADIGAFSGLVLIEGTFSGIEGADLATFTGLLTPNAVGTFSGTDGADSAFFTGWIPGPHRQPLPARRDWWDSDERGNIIPGYCIRR